MGLLLGIDTGGTYTDAVLLDPQGGVRAVSKALTTRHDLALGIDRALDSVLDDSAREVVLVGLSTTLATNALVESQGSPICLLLLGYQDSALERASLRQALGDDPVCFIAGGHDAHGRELAPLDQSAVREAIARYAPLVGAFAVSGQFGVRNPEHELAVMNLVRELSGLPVSCGHHLSFALHAPRRALTAALNARLIPLIADLMEAVRRPGSPISGAGGGASGIGVRPSAVWGGSERRRRGRWQRRLAGRGEGHPGVRHPVPGALRQWREAAGGHRWGPGVGPGGG